MFDSCFVAPGSWHMRFADAVAWAQRHPAQDESETVAQLSRKLPGKWACVNIDRAIF